MGGHPRNLWDVPDHTSCKRFVAVWCECCIYPRRCLGPFIVIYCFSVSFINCFNSSAPSAIVIVLVKVEKGAKGKIDSGAVLVHTILIVVFVHDILVDIRK